MGLVQVKHGRGMWVLPSSRWDHLSPLLLFERLQVPGDNQGLFNDLLEVRRLVEVEAAGLAAARRTPADLPALQAAVAGMRAQPDDPDAHTRLDVEFHDRILAAARNDLLRELVRPVAEVLGAARSLTSRNGRLAESLFGHEAILAAVEAGDGQAAREAMRIHIASFERDLAQYARLRDHDDTGVKEIIARQQTTQGEVA
jgi:DNA-binding FadR family transcriptional regulator